MRILSMVNGTHQMNPPPSCRAFHHHPRRRRRPRCRHYSCGCQSRSRSPPRCSPPSERPSAATTVTAAAAQRGDRTGKSPRPAGSPGKTDDRTAFSARMRDDQTSCVYLRCIQCHLVVDMTLDAPKINATFEGQFGTLH